MARLEGDHQRLAHREVGEQPGVLEDTPHAEPRTPVLEAAQAAADSLVVIDGVLRFGAAEIDRLSALEIARIIVDECMGQRGS